MKSNRREFIQSLGTGAAGLTLAAPIGLSSCVNTQQTQEDDGQVLFVGDNIAVTETTNGKVRGYILRDIYYFLGIPYGADTSGNNRFMPPQKPEPWTDIFPALWWGNGAPQLIDGIYTGKNIHRAFVHHANFDDISENCLSVNVFTPGINDNKKRPVLLWMHGGAWHYGISHEHDGTIGENLARFGDVVFCSINHRLGPMGFSDFSGVAGEKYTDSGNAGALDLVAALKWIQENITNFGGDPSNVTIMGQSGGGGKVVTTAAMPAAKGLFGKAVVLSGADMVPQEAEMMKKVGEYILKEARLKPSQIDKLQEMPWEEYYELALKAAKKYIADTGTELSATKIFQPQVDGIHIPKTTFDKDSASEIMTDIPMIISSCTNEQSNAYKDPLLESISFDGVKKELIKNYGEQTGKIVDAYSEAFPDKKPVEIMAMISGFRQRAVALADVKSKQSAPVYLAWFGWNPPMFDNRMRAFHCLDICFWLYNTDVMFTHTGGGSRPRKLSEKLAGSLVNFMKTGDPNGAGLPDWPKYNAQNGLNMLLDDNCVVKFDPDREARNLIPSII